MLGWREGGGWGHGERSGGLGGVAGDAEGRRGGGVGGRGWLGVPGGWEGWAEAELVCRTGDRLAPLGEPL